MHNVSGFQHDVSQLLQHLGFPLVALDPQQEVLSLTVDQGFDLHLSYLDAAHWLMLTRLPEAQTTPAAALQANQPTRAIWQPVLAWDVDHRLCCWLRIPTGVGGLPTLLAALDTLIACSEHWLHTPPAEEQSDRSIVALREQPFPRTSAAVEE